MILHFNYEELSALKQGARVLLEDAAGERCAVAAPPESRAPVEALVSRLDGDLTIHTLDEQRTVEVAVDAIVECLRLEMEAAVVAYHPAHEGAVAAYFDFAHGLSVRERVHDVGNEMRALIELVTGGPPTRTLASTFVFPD